MRRGWMRIAGWTLATGVLIGTSWYGVHSVLAEPDGGAHAAYTSDGLPPLSESARSAPAPASPVSSPTASASATGERTYAVAGGTAVLEIGASSATLVSATPGPGWQRQEWNQTGWIRVLFTDGQHVSSVICSWNGHPPTVRTYAD